MSVGVLFVTHNDIGEQLSITAGSILKRDLPQLAVVSIPSNLNPSMLGTYADRLRDSLSRLVSGQGVLVLTDIHGATPYNLARHFCANADARVVSGLNLPMLLRVLNYSTQSLEHLSETAIAGGKTGVKKDRE